MSRAQHLAFVCPRFSDTGTVGGAETLLKNLALHAAEAGRQVTFLTTCAQDHFTWQNTRPPGEQSFRKLRVIRFPVDEDRNVESFLRVQTVISRNGNVSPAQEKTWIENSVNSRALYHHLRAHGHTYDWILVGPYLFGLTYFATRIHPEKTLLVPCLHDEPFAYLDIMKEMFGRVAGCLFNTEPEMDLARRLFNLPVTRCFVVGMGLDPFTPDPQAAERFRSDGPYLMYAGRREPLKGTPLLVDYVRTFRERTGKELRLVFTGSGPIDRPPEMERHITDLGFVSEEEKHAAMAGAVAFCHPSVNESLGIVLLEAWLAETPALVHAGSDVLRWQCRRSGGGLWFRHYPEFEEELLLLWNDQPLRRQMGRAGRAYVLETYAWTSVEQRLFAALNAL